MKNCSFLFHGEIHWDEHRFLKHSLKSRYFQQNESFMKCYKRFIIIIIIIIIIMFGKKLHIQFKKSHKPMHTYHAVIWLHSEKVETIQHTSKIKFNITRIFSQVFKNRFLVCIAHRPFAFCMSFSTHSKRQIGSKNYAAPHYEGKIDAHYTYTVYSDKTFSL
jgi:hypothetical protein